jgi:hypothetical protein
MNKLPLALVTLAAGAAGAGALYFLDPTRGPQRRAMLGERLSQWRDAAADQAHDTSHGTEQRLRELLSEARDWLDHLLGRAEVEVEDDDGLAPLEMTPPPVEQHNGRRIGMLPMLAVATPVAVAVGAAWLHKHDDGHWVH